MKVLVCGGAGFIGSNVVIKLHRSGYKPIIVDNFSNSNPTVLERLELLLGKKIEFIKTDLRNSLETRKLLDKTKPDAIIQLAGLKSVEESQIKPLSYYNTNIGITLNILNAMSQNNCNKIIFSSSATVYGYPKTIPISENHSILPINPYGYTKYFQEQIIKDWASTNHKAYSIILRYFNPVGADISGLIGEDPVGIPNNLMPILGKAAFDKKLKVEIFGNNYNTRDGTCERDYIHVSDLADAHVAALNFEMIDKRTEIFNVGTGKGITVKEAIETYSKHLSSQLSYKYGPARVGDAPTSVAENKKILQLLDWKPTRNFDDACRDDICWRNYIYNN